MRCIIAETLPPRNRPASSPWLRVKAQKHPSAGHPCVVELTAPEGALAFTEADPEGLVPREYMWCRKSTPWGGLRNPARALLTYGVSSDILWLEVISVDFVPFHRVS
jgi:hypothetical protein